LLLGPARFVNHDCEPNSRFITTNKENIQLIVLKDIEIGEEITVCYADDYFGVGNRECLCRSCEALVKNGWASELSGELQEVDSNTVDMEEAPVIRRTRSKRKNDNVTELPPPPEKRLKRKADKEDALTPPYSDRASSEDLKVAKAAIVSMEVELKPQTPVDNIPPTPITNAGTPIPSAIKTFTLDETADIAQSLLALAQSPSYHKPQFSPQTTAPRNFADRGPEFGRALSYGNMVQTNTFEPPNLPPRNTVPPAFQPGPFVAGPVIGNSSGTGAPSWINGNFAVIETAPEAPRSSISSEDAALKSEPSEASDSGLDKVAGKDTTPPASQPQDPASSKKRKSISMPPSEPAHKRFPGDYIKFYDSDCIKCTCMDCHEDFIHNDRWYVPRSCRRCERHSKIYGLMWPKTVKKKGDSEVSNVLPPRHAVTCANSSLRIRSKITAQYSDMSPRASTEKSRSVWQLRSSSSKQCRASNPSRGEVGRLHISFRVITFFTAGIGGALRSILGTVRSLGVLFSFLLLLLFWSINFAVHALLFFSAVQRFGRLWTFPYIYTAATSLQIIYIPHVDPFYLYILFLSMLSPELYSFAVNTMVYGSVQSQHLCSQYMSRCHECRNDHRRLFF